MLRLHQENRYFPKQDDRQTLHSVHIIYITCETKCVVYLIKCKRSQMQYVGMTTRALYFHCLEITNCQQWEVHVCITSVMTCDWCNDSETITTTITKRRLEWLGHVAGMPKMDIFGWLSQTRPPEGPCMRWRDCIRKKLEGSWYARNNVQ